MTDNHEAELNKVRANIDEIDARILELMNRRITHAQRIGEIKAELAQPAYYRPEREAKVLRRLRELNRGPMDDAALESLFREIMSVTRGSEAGLCVAVLGPLGTYSEAAARQHFGSAVQLAAHASIDEVFRSVEAGAGDFAVVPVENSTEGGVSATLERLATTPLLACGEINLRIRHNLLGRGTLQSVKRVSAHAQSLAQCKNWLARNLPDAELLAVASNAEAAVRARDEETTAAIAGAAAARQYELEHLAANIEDRPGNSTRFLILSSRATPPSGDDKTSLLLSCRHRPGALLHLLNPLMKHQIDMTRLESRPSKAGLWEYIFFVDIRGHQDSETIAAALAEIKSEAVLYKNLGSYPASQ